MVPVENVSTRPANDQEGTLSLEGNTETDARDTAMATDSQSRLSPSPSLASRMDTDDSPPRSFRNPWGMSWPGPLPELDRLTPSRFGQRTKMLLKIGNNGHYLKPLQDNELDLDSEGIWIETTNVSLHFDWPMVSVSRIHPNPSRLTFICLQNDDYSETMQAFLRHLPRRRHQACQGYA